MPRKARIDAPGALHHIICRGIERRKIFRADTDRDDFLDRVAKALLDSQTPCYAWALLPNHLHFLVTTMDDLDHYAYSGHSAIMGHSDHPWQRIDEVLGRFGGHARTAKRAYRSFVEKGIPLGKRPELTGGGLIRSLGGWGEIKAMRRAKDHCKGDERILGDSGFVESVLANQGEHLERRCAVQAQGYDFHSVVTRVGEIFGLEAETITAPGKQRRRADARALVCYLATRELGMTAISVARLIGVTQPAVSRAVYRGEALAKERNLQLAAPPG